MQCCFVTHDIKSGKNLVWEDRRWHTALCACLRTHIGTDTQRGLWSKKKKKENELRIHMYLQARSKSRLGERGSRNGMDKGIWGGGSWGCALTVKNKRLYYVSTANAQCLPENVPTTVFVCVFVCFQAAIRNPRTKCAILPADSERIL